MLTARTTSAWKSRYEIAADGVAVAFWDKSFWKGGGAFELDGRRHEVRTNVWGSRFTMTDPTGMPVAVADRVGHKRWTVEAGGRTYTFRRTSVWGNAQSLYDGDRELGSVRRAGFWSSTVEADLPGLPLPMQIFVVGVVLTMWDQQAATAAATS